MARLVRRDVRSCGVFPTVRTRAQPITEGRPARERKPRRNLRAGHRQRFLARLSARTTATRGGRISTEGRKEDGTAFSITSSRESLSLPAGNVQVDRGTIVTV